LGGKWKWETLQLRRQVHFLHCNGRRRWYINIKLILIYFF
jgi:hypothetical protein